MTSKSHESIKLVNFRIVYSAIDTIYTFQHKWNAHKFWVFWRALKYFALNDRKIASFNRKNE